MTLERDRDCAKRKRSKKKLPSKNKQKLSPTRGLEPIKHFPSLYSHLANVEGMVGIEPFSIPVYWDDTSESSERVLKKTILAGPNNVGAHIEFQEKPKFIEIFSIDVRPKGTGFGRRIMDEIKHYANAKKKGIVLTKVKNERFAESMGFTRREPIVDDRPLSEITGFAEYVYGDVPEDAIDYAWVTEE